MAENLYSFRETFAFTKKVTSKMSEESYFELQDYLQENWSRGDLIPHGKGLRKIRWRAEGRGKRGGFRVIYYLATKQGYIYFLALYAKNEKTDLSREELKDLTAIVEDWLK